MKSLVIGVLALQGAFFKHMEVLSALGVSCIEVRTPEELQLCDGLIIPGGESTTMMKQMKFIDFIEPFHLFSKKKPVFGTCAGIILMSKEILGSEMTPFSLLDIQVERNAFGRQIESFQVPLDLTFNEHKRHVMQALFIRAPRIIRSGADVKILGILDGEPVLVEQGLHLGATFHPELTQDYAIHRYFLEKIKNQ